MCKVHHFCYTKLTLNELTRLFPRTTVIFIVKFVTAEFSGVSIVQTNESRRTSWASVAFSLDTRSPVSMATALHMVVSSSGMWNIGSWTDRAAVTLKQFTEGVSGHHERWIINQTIQEHQNKISTNKITLYIISACIVKLTLPLSLIVF